jgi:hypothetical protein
MSENTSYQIVSVKQTINLMIKIQSYSIQDLLLTKGIVSTFISKFWIDIFSPIIKSGENQKHLMILVKVQFTDSSEGYRTLGHLRRINFEDKNQFIDYIVERLSILNDSYRTLSVSNIIFNYIIRDGEASGTRTLLLNTEDVKVKAHRFNNMNLPVTMNPSEYGEIRSIQNTSSYTRYIVRSLTNKLFEIDVSLDKLVNKVTMLGASDLKWTDTSLSDGSFKREIQKSTIYFLDGEIILRKQVLPVKPFRKLQE